MEKSNSIFVVPNYPVSLKNGLPSSKPDQRKFFIDLLSYFNQVSVCADVLTEGRAAHSLISNDPKFLFYALNKYSDKKGFDSRLLAKFNAFKILMRLVGKHDLVYIFLPGYSGIIACIACLFVGKKYSLYYRGNLEHAGQIIRRMYLFFSRFASFSLCTGYAMKKLVKASGGEAELVLPMTSFTYEETKEQNLKVRYTSGELRILFVGALALNKGVIDALECVSRLVCENKQTKLILVGGLDDSFKELFWGAVDRLKIQDNIEVVGFLSDKNELKRYYQTSHIFLFPSSREGFPRAVYEAMMYMLPVVMYDLPEVQGFLKNGINSVLVQVNNKKELFNELRRLSRNKEKMHEVGCKGYKDVMSMFRKFSCSSHAEQLSEKQKTVY